MTYAQNAPLNAPGYTVEALMSIFGPLSCWTVHRLINKRSHSWPLHGGCLVEWVERPVPVCFTVGDGVGFLVFLGGMVYYPERTWIDCKTKNDLELGMCCSILLAWAGRRCPMPGPVERQFPWQSPVSACESILRPPLVHKGPV